MAVGDLVASGGALPLIFWIHICSGPIYWGWGIIYLAEKIIRWWYFTCKEPENIICDGIVHVNMFHYFQIPCIICTFFSKFIYNEYTDPTKFYRTLFLNFLPMSPPPELVVFWVCRSLLCWYRFRCRGRNVWLSSTAQMTSWTLRPNSILKICAHEHTEDQCLCIMYLANSFDIVLHW